MKQARGEIYLGVRFDVSIHNAPSIRTVAKAMRDVLTAARRNPAIKLSGNWGGALQYLETLESRLKASIKAGLRDVAARYERAVREGWKGESVPMRPLEPSYIQSKIQKGLDRRKLIATQTSLKSLGFTSSSPWSIAVGVTALKKGEPYMLDNEFGTADGRVPARPLFRPVLERVMDALASIMVKAINTALHGGVYTARGAA
jgi:hypothetical protein